MTTPRDYLNNVVGRTGIHRFHPSDNGHYRRGMLEETELFQGNDTPDKWNMRRIATSGPNEFWEVGYIHRGTLAYANDPSHIGFTPSYFYARLSPAPSYWWCRDGDWLPFWGSATQHRADLGKELRAYWMNKWFGETVPEIKLVLRTRHHYPMT